MAQEVNLGGATYVTSKRAAEISGYAQDYIGQLARSGQIEARRVSGLWYVSEDSLNKHKERADEFVPQPPDSSSRVEAESSIEFDGKEFLSASRASNLTGYSQDYVAQLARTAKVSAHQIGTRWYVERVSLLNHKSEKDSLLAAVQAESVGLQHRMVADAPIQAPEEALTYAPDEAELLPSIQEKPVAEIELEVQPEETSMSNEDDEEIDQMRAIPIRVVDSAPKHMHLQKTYIVEPEVNFEKSLQSYAMTPRITMILVVFLGLGSTALGAYMYLKSERSDVSDIAARVQTVESTVVGSSGGELPAQLASAASALFSKELYYHR